MDEGNSIDIGMDDFVSNTHAMEGILVHAFEHNELGYDIDIANTLFQLMNLLPPPHF